MLHIQKINFHDFKKIKKLFKSNSHSNQSLQTWKSLNDLTAKNKSLVMYGLFSKKKLVGFHAVIIKHIIYNKKKYKVLVSSNWNVLSKFRYASMYLLKHYFNLKTDFYLTTTANEKTSLIWSKLGALTVNKESTELSLFNIVNYRDIIEFYLLKRKLYFFKKYFSSFFSFVLKIIFSYKKIFLTNKELFLTNKELSFQLIDSKANELKKFIKKFENNTTEPLETRDNDTLSKHIKLLNLNKKKNFTFLILYKKNTVGYFVLSEQYKLKFKSIFLSELRLSKKYHYKINEIISYILAFASKKRYSLIYFRNIYSNLLNKINKKIFFIKKFNYCPYLIKAGSGNGRKIVGLIRKKMNISNFDGDLVL